MVTIEDAIEATLIAIDYDVAGDSRFRAWKRFPYPTGLRASWNGIVAGVLPPDAPGDDWLAKFVVEYTVEKAVMEGILVMPNRTNTVVLKLLEKHRWVKQPYGMRRFGDRLVIYLGKWPAGFERAMMEVDG